MYFDNGKIKVAPEYNPQLIALAEKAKSVKGYMIEVKEYASKTGSASVNQKLSEDRANGVTSILLQQGHVPLTNMLAPGAMGESVQVSTAKQQRVRPRTVASWFGYFKTKYPAAACFKAEWRTVRTVSCLA